MSGNWQCPLCPNLAYFKCELLQAQVTLLTVLGKEVGGGAVSLPCTPWDNEAEDIHRIYINVLIYAKYIYAKCILRGSIPPMHTMG